MREILFRGFYEDKKGEEKAFYGGAWHRGKWVYGTPQTNARGQTFICADMMLGWDVAPLTIGQFTGLTDKNGKKIFEGDILGKHGFWSLVVEFQRIMPLHPVQYNNSKGIPIYSFDSTSWEIIGNIYDNFCPNCGADMRRESEVKE